MTHTIASRLAQLGLDLPHASAPAANYVSTRRSGNLVFIAGQISLRDGQPAFIGHVGGNLSLDEGRKAAESAVLGLLAQVAAATDGTVAVVHGVIQLRVFVAATPDFTQHAEVANGASDLLAQVFGDAGRHVRTTVGVSSLPAGVCVELDAVLELAS